MKDFTLFFIFSIVAIIIFLIVASSLEGIRGRSTFLYTFLFALYVLIVVLLYISSAASSTGGKEKDQANKDAHGYYTTAAVIGWISLSLLIIYIVYGIYKIIKRQGPGDGFFAITVVWLIIILTFILGIIASIGAGYQGNSSSKEGYRAAIVAATSAIVVSVALVVVFIVEKVKK